VIEILLSVLRSVVRMKAVEVDGTKVLLVKDNGTFHAVGAKCTHYGAPLASGTITTHLLNSVCL